METSPIGKMIVAAIAECKYESSVDKVQKDVFAQIKTDFPKASLTQFFYYWEKAAGAKKKSIRRSMNGGDY